MRLILISSAPASNSYWASLSASADLTGNLEAWVINRDQARIGDSLAAAALAAPSSGHGALWWRLINASYYPADEDVLQAVLQERTWLAVVGEQEVLSVKCQPCVLIYLGSQYKCVNFLEPGPCDRKQFI